MLLANGHSVIQGLGRSGHSWLSGLQGTAEVSGLQTALTNLAIATGRPAINPGKVDGVVGAPTVMAVIAASDLLSQQLGTTTFLALKAAIAAATLSSQADAAAITGITALAGPLTVACNTLAIKYKQNPALVASLTPWYQTPIGIGVLILGAIVGYKVLFGDKTPAKAA